MSIRHKIGVLSSALALASNLGLVDVVNAGDIKKRLPTEKPAPIELKTLSQWGVPSIEGLDPYDKYKSVSIKRKAKNVELYRIDGIIVIRYVLDGKTSEVFVCSAPPKSTVGYYFSSAGNGLFENLSPENVSCNTSEYK